MLPKSYDTPVRLPQGPCNELIPHLVCHEFLPPESCVVFGLSHVLWATMPETAIHKHRKSELGKNEIRFTKDGLMPPPAGNTVVPKKLRKCQFRILVATRADE